MKTCYEKTIQNMKWRPETEKAASAGISLTCFKVKTIFLVSF